MNVNDVRLPLRSSPRSETYVSLPKLAQLGFPDISTLPFSLKVLLESAVRHCEGGHLISKDVAAIAQWSPDILESKEIIFYPGRVILQDFTGVPCLVDLAAMRDALKARGINPRQINPQLLCDLVIDHSVQTDFSGTSQSYSQNLRREFQRNKERYRFLKWGQNAFQNLRVIPPSAGIIHQINLEYLAQGVLKGPKGRFCDLYPDSVIGTDSHTTMINALGIVGWGVGGIEAEAVMLGEPLNMLLPQVIGVEITGDLPQRVTPTDLVLSLVHVLRREGVVDKFVEFFGSGLKQLSLPNRAMIANMAPEYGATLGYFPLDEETLRYYRLTGRRKSQIDLIERYYRLQGLFYDQKHHAVRYTKVLRFNLADVQPCLAGPKRPQDKVLLSDVPQSFDRQFSLPSLGHRDHLDHGSIAIASITSCTNTSDPFVLIGAGLLARNAVHKGLKVKPFVKTSFAPGSRVTVAYLKASGLLKFLEKLGFYLVGYGCMTCIGNSGSLKKQVSQEINKRSLIVASILSGNRNFEGRINPLVKANYLASPMLVIAYALAGNIRADLHTQPIGKDRDGNDVYLQDLWPSSQEIDRYIKKYIHPALFRSTYRHIASGTSQWKQIKVCKSDLFSWNRKSTYIQKPPFFDCQKQACGSKGDILNARVLAVFGDSVTTDHISPAGQIPVHSPAGDYLRSLGVAEKDFNSYGARRGNDRVMIRGTFANIRLRNLLLESAEGSRTIHFPDAAVSDIYSIAMRYAQEKVPLILIAGKEYGTGSSRDWAAKGTALLGIQAVIAESFERIHRSNLAGMGVLPLQFEQGQNFKSLGLKGDERYSVLGLSGDLTPCSRLLVRVDKADGSAQEFPVILRLDTKVEITYYQYSGILQTVLNRIVT